MNIRGGSKDRIDIKRLELKLELEKPEELKNKKKIKRLQESIKRNKNISHKYSRIRRQKKRRWKQKKKY